ncbi:hypothetical protein B0H13DRAFT_2660424 [Mycena leptocephala]|nr:hypothetical protein B0H13DRAFT_2660424 [Mycena leptocephala]
MPDKVTPKPLACNLDADSSLFGPRPPPSIRAIHARHVPRTPVPGDVLLAAVSPGRRPRCTLSICPRSVHTCPRTSSPDINGPHPRSRSTTTVPMYSHPAHSFHAPREPPSASPITSTSVGAPVLPAGSSRGERPAVRGKVRECDSNKDRDKTKDKGKDIDCAKPLERQPYHPTPPVSRSDWVMWAGNVPRDARHDELWRFFTEGAGSVAHGHGILSIFLIARSACAFVNYSSSAALSAAIAQFDGVPLRAGYAG